MTTLPHDSPVSFQPPNRDAPLPVLLLAAGPVQQPRWTVLIRWIMLIPHFFVLYFLNIAAAVVAFIGWWGALFTGQLPEFAVSFISGLARWSARVQAYALLLTDQYPPFSFGDEPAYPVRIAIPQRDKLNRWAVFFRVILAIPAALLTVVVLYGGTTIVAFIAWLIALVTGKLPKSLHLAYTAILRYSTRYYCYYYMLTAAYPRGLFGDGLALLDEAPLPPAGDLNPAVAVPEGPADAVAPVSEAPVDASGPSPEAPVDAAVPGSEIPVDPAAPGSEVPLAAAAPGYGVAGFEVPVDPEPLPPVEWRLLLTRGARQLIGWFIGIGVVIFAVVIAVGGIRASITTGNAAIARVAIINVNVANSALASELSKYQSTVQACTNATCVETADTQAANAFTAFASKVNGTPMPTTAVADANSVSADATKVAQDLTRLSQLGPSISSSQYESTANGMNISQATAQFQQDQTALDNALNSYAH